MSEFAIRAVSLSKQYQIGSYHQPSMLRDQLRDSVRAGLSRLSGRRSPAGKEYPTQQIWALKDVTFQIRQGESIGIIGANGAGKTTLLKILARITSPTAGKVRLCGRVGSLLEVGTGFHSELTGRENIYLNGAILGMRKAEIERKFAEIVDFSGVEQFIETPVKRYSTGMRMRLAFSVAAHLEPEILLIDEVLAVGDIAFQKKSLKKMESVVNEGRTVLFVSHNLGAVRAFCPKSIYLEGGLLKYIGDTDAAIQVYLGDNQSADETGDHKIDPKLDVQLLNITPSDEHGDFTGTFAHDSPLYFRVKIHVKTIKYKTHISLKIYNSELETILTTRDFESSGKFLIPTTPGDYEFMVKLPANLLAPGNYHLGGFVSGITPKNRVRTYHRFDHAAEFDVFDNGSLLSQHNLPWDGLVHADVEWKKI